MNLFKRAFKRAGSTQEDLIEAALLMSASDSLTGSLSNEAKRELCVLAWNDLSDLEKKLCSHLRGSALAQVALAGALSYGFSPAFRLRRQVCRMLVASQDHFALCVHGARRPWLFLSAATLVALACAVEEFAPWGSAAKSLAVSFLAAVFCVIALIQSKAPGGWAGLTGREVKASWLAKKYWPDLKRVYLSAPPSLAFEGFQRLYSLAAPYTVPQDELRELPEKDSVQWIESLAQQRALEQTLEAKGPSERSLARRGL